MEIFTVWNCGPVLCGRVAIFENEIEAKNFCNAKNGENAFSPWAIKNDQGISKAWLMGDGRHLTRKEELTLPDNYFVWE